MNCTNKEQETCQVEKRGCDGCAYNSRKKKMQYGIERKVEILDTGYCFGLLYYIMNLGTYPTAYIKIPKDHKYYKKDMYEVDIYVHGGITYSSDHLWISKNNKIDGWFIGWDYAHCGDYAGYEEKLPKELKTGDKKWTTEEIFEQVKDACYQLKKIKE